MRLLVPALVTAGVLGTGAGAAAQGSAAPPSAPAPAWTWQPSLYLLASADENTELPFPSFPIGFEEPAFAGNLGAGVDGMHRAARSQLTANLFGLVRSPISGPDRTVFASGRLGWSWQPTAAWRIDVRDSAKIQRRPRLEAGGFQRNDGAVAMEWRLKPGAGLSVEVGDRRRALPELPILGFSRQSATVSVLTSTRRVAAEAGVGVQRYAAPTSTGRRIVISGEVGHFGTRTIASARYVFGEPRADRPRMAEDLAGEQQGEFGDIQRGDFLEQLALAGSEFTTAGEVFAIDPIETDSDDWDFGRRKHVVVGYVARRMPADATLSGSIRYQSRNGPNLLAPVGSPLAAPFHDDRVAIRVTFRRPFTARVALIAQASYLRNRGDRTATSFSRKLVGGGLQIQF